MVSEQELNGKTIKKAVKRKIKQEYDDEPYLDLEMTDGTIYCIEADYGGYTGNSEDEYPRYICIECKSHGYRQGKPCGM